MGKEQATDNKVLLPPTGPPTAHVTTKRNEAHGAANKVLGLGIGATAKLVGMPSSPGQRWNGTLEELGTRITDVARGSIYPLGKLVRGTSG